MCTTKRSLPWALRAAVATAALATMIGCKGNAPPAETQPSPSTPAPAATAVPARGEPIRVEVTGDGFQPARVTLGATHQVVFRRTTDSTCATAVVFPAFGIEKPLPLNADVVVDLPASAHGEVGFQCSMEMYKGKVVVQ